MITWTTVLCSWAHIHNCPGGDTSTCEAQGKHGSAGEVPRGGWRAEGLLSMGSREALVDTSFETQQDFSFLFSFLFSSLSLSLWSSSFPPVSLPLVFFPLLWWAAGITGAIIPSSHCLSSGRQELSCVQASRPRNFPSRYRDSETTDMCHLIQLLMWISDIEHCKSGWDSQLFPHEVISQHSLRVSECIISNILSFHPLILFLLD